MKLRILLLSLIIATSIQAQDCFNKCNDCNFANDYRSAWLGMTFQAYTQAEIELQRSIEEREWWK